MLLQENSTWVLAGDSITDCGRARPVGEAHGDGLGNGYVAQLDALLKTGRRDPRVRVVNMGGSGDTARRLAARWEADILALAPDYVSIMIGINDVWRQMDSPQQTALHVYPQEYEETLEQLVQATLPRVKGLFLFSPYYIEPNRQDAMRKLMDEYGAIMKAVAQKHSLPFVDVQAAFDRYLESHYSATLAWDRVHPNLAGHCLIAREILQVLQAD